MSTSTSPPEKDKNDVKTDGKTEKLVIGIVAGIAVLLVLIYVGIVFYMWSQDSGLFAPYSAPDPPSNTYQPRGELVPLTDSQLKIQACLYQNFLNKDFESICTGDDDDS